MREKYVEERFPRYFVWGSNAVTNVVDVSTVNKDICTTTPEAAKVVIDDRDEIVTFLWQLADAFDKANPEEFKKFWYGG